VDDRVEPARQPGVEVVALTLALGPVDDADRALQARPGERLLQLATAPQDQPETLAASVVEQIFAALGQAPGGLNLSPRDRPSCSLP
jgi:hypothetical protein